MYNNNTFNLEDFNKKYNEIVENIKSTGALIEEISIKTEIKEQLQVYNNELFIPPIISNDLIIKIEVCIIQLIDSQNEIKKGIEEMKNIFFGIF